MSVTSIQEAKSLAFFYNNLDIVDDIGEAGIEFFQADTYTDRWVALRRVGDLVAPRIDGYFALPRELHEDISYDKVLNALAELPAARAPGRPPRDGKWLQGAIQLFNLLLPIITSLAIQKG